MNRGLTMGRFSSFLFSSFSFFPFSLFSSFFRLKHWRKKAVKRWLLGGLPLQSVLCGFPVGCGGGLFCLSPITLKVICTNFISVRAPQCFPFLLDFFFNIILAGPGPLMILLSKWFAQSSDGASSVSFFIYDIKRITENNFVAQHQWYIFRPLER